MGILTIFSIYMCLTILDILELVLLFLLVIPNLMFFLLLILSQTMALLGCLSFICLILALLRMFRLGSCFITIGFSFSFFLSTINTKQTTPCTCLQLAMQSQYSNFSTYPNIYLQHRVILIFFILLQRIFYFPLNCTIIGSFKVFKCPNRTD